MKFILSIIVLLFSTSVLLAEDLPVKWSYSVEYLEKGKVDLQFKASMEEGWHIYSIDPELTPPSGNTEFTFKLDSTNKIVLEGSVTEGTGHTYFEGAFEQDIKEFEGVAKFSQIIDANKIASNENVSV